MVGLISFGFTHFVFVEAMAKTFAVHTDRVALTLAPLVWFLGRVLEIPTRFLIGLASSCRAGLKQGPFVSEEEIRSMAEVGSEEDRSRKGEGADPLDLRVRRHDRPRGDGAAPGHRRDRGRQDAPRRPGARPVARVLPDPRLPRVARRREGRRVREGRAESAAPGRRTCPSARSCGRRTSCRRASGWRAAEDAAREVPPGARVRRARLRHRHRRARGPLEELVGEIADEYDRENQRWSSATASTGSPGRRRSTT